MAEIAEGLEKKRDRLLTLKGFGYIITGDALIFYSLIMMGLLIENLAPIIEEHPIGVGVIIWGLFLIGLAWGVILIWKGVHMIPPKKITKLRDQEENK